MMHLEPNEEALKPELTDDFIATLIKAAKTYGWSGDYGEVVGFVEWCLRLSDREAEDLEPFD
jgi:hypothetical protein